MLRLTTHGRGMAGPRLGIASSIKHPPLASRVTATENEHKSGRESARCQRGLSDVAVGDRHLDAHTVENRPPRGWALVIKGDHSSRALESKLRLSLLAFSTSLVLSCLKCWWRSFNKVAS